MVGRYRFLKIVIFFFLLEIVRSVIGSNNLIIFLDKLILFTFLVNG